MLDNIPSELSLEKAAQCWCTEETKHITMDVELAVAFARVLDEKDTVEHCMAVLTQAMQDTELGSYAHSWHCNIAMSVYDSVSEGVYPGKAHQVGNEAASRFMKLCFGVDTKNTVNQPRDK